MDERLRPGQRGPVVPPVSDEAKRDSLEVEIRRTSLSRLVEIRAGDLESRAVLKDRTEREMGRRSAKKSEVEGSGRRRLSGNEPCREE